MKIQKAILWAVLIVILFVPVCAFFAWEYGVPISRKALRYGEVQVVSAFSERHTNVSIDGVLLGSAFAVYGVNRFQWGRSVVIVVREGIVHDGKRVGDFHLNITVPDDVNKITFGTPGDVIWHR